MKIINEKLYIDGMVCESCEKRIERELKKTKGVKSAKANYKESSLFIEYNLDICNKKIINDILNKNGYSIVHKDKNINPEKSEWIYILGIIIITFLILKLGQNSGNFNIADNLNNAGFITLFVIGLLSSLHCVGMCGGIMMSQSITIDKGSKFENLKPALKYNLGRLISYTVLGGLVGGLGKVISLSLGGQALISIIAGAFMMIMGINMFGFKALRKLSIKLPWSNCKTNNKNNAPFIVGLLNGFMPCGPLQTMQLYALATGSIFIGAASMFFFALGTIPLMLAFGLISNSLSQKNSNRLMKISGVIIVVLGISMASRGLALLGVNVPSIGTTSSAVTNSADEDIKGNKAEIIDGKQIVRISANSSGYTPREIYIQKNIPTEVIIEGDRITSCNNEVIIPSFNIQKKLSSGSNIIEFTSEDEDIKYSCWMGMKRGVLKVVDDLSIIDDTDVSTETPVEQEIQFYGLPISKVETNRLIKTAELLDNIQKIDSTTTKGNFEPSVIILNDSNETMLNYKINNKQSDGVYTIVNDDFSKVLTTFEIVNGNATTALPKLESGIYGIIKDNGLYQVLEVHSDVNSVDKELLRKNYF